MIMVDGNSLHEVNNDANKKCQTILSVAPTCVDSDCKAKCAQQHPSNSYGYCFYTGVGQPVQCICTYLCS